MSNQLNMVDDWKVTNDGVMGGLSSGQVAVINDNIHFSGQIAIDNNGGFTSVFMPIDVPDNTATIRITVIGDGNNYQFRFRSEVQGYMLAYKMYFTTSPNKAVTHTFKLSEFKASFRGRDISNAPLLQASSIAAMGFLFSAKQPQQFSLSILSIDFFSKIS